MTIAFNEVPANLRVPGVYIEINGAGAAAGLGDQPYRILMFGQRTTAGTVAANVPTRVRSAAEAAKYFGVGSMIHGMVKASVANNRQIETMVIAMADPGAGVAATATISFAVTTPTPGTLNFHVAGQRVQVGVTSSSTDETLATATAAAINAETSLPVTAEVNGSDATQVDLTCRHKGTIGNEIDLRVNYYDGESTPAGVTPTIVGFANGTGTPDLAAAMAVAPADQYIIWVAPYVDASLLTALEAELQDRWGPTRNNGGVAFTASSASHSTVAALGESRNSEHLSIMGAYGSPTPTYEYAAAVAATVGGSAERDPARPFQTLELKGVGAPIVSQRWDDTERNLLLFDGIATTRVAPGGTVVLERVITTYQQDNLGTDDIAFLDVNSVLTVDRLRYDMRGIMAKYPRHKLGIDSKNYASGDAIVTPSMIRAELISLFSEWEEKAWVEDAAQFAQDMVVERDSEDPNRLNIQISPNLINQLRVVGAQISFIL